MLVPQLCPTLWDPMDCSLPGSSVQGILQTRILELFPSPGDCPKLGIKPRSPTLQADSLSAEPPVKPKNTGVGSLSLLQRISPTQESNGGILHCRRILYQLAESEEELKKPLDESERGEGGKGWEIGTHTHTLPWVVQLVKIPLKYLVRFWVGKIP